jgi:hypothetical protein
MNAKTTAIAVLALSAVLLVSCGGDTYVKVEGTTTISKGQELTDLQRALAEGAITQSDYDSVRAKILRRPN